MNLYIIGNGFDLWHCLPTGYDSFYKFGKETLDELENFYDVGVSHIGPWHDFENTLGQFNCDDFFDSNNHIDVISDSFRPSFLYSLEDDLSEQSEVHVEAIKDLFCTWVEGIDISGVNKKLEFSEDDIFINFNYTSTLEIAYGVSEHRILHVHGRAGHSSDLIFGHGVVLRQEPELDEYGDSTRTMFTDAKNASMYPLYAFKKPVENVLEKNQRFFDSLSDISNVIVIGHSLNSIDLPYFKRVVQVVGTVSWVVYIYDIDQKHSVMETLVSCGVKKEWVEIALYPALEAKYADR
ncbi:bacteriophage abortive infection AbiH family protein [Idiomarina piscisalsi]|uniref:bacteriophage abortive infection AbiH family protein n=1 Tax=Idiomarina piscisalsi TaxID=1096243 RepID=UPI001383C344|nr:bacteriophage abortive infection AbiH family protein [Idiomarina piscisalsi]MTJ02659.1 hypothetical protein [Idiomarina piscisalsi]